jgi:signal peptidase I
MSGPRTADRVTGSGGRRRARGSSLVTVLLLAAVIVFGLLALPRVFGYGTLVVRSGSMQQTAPVGSLVVARPLDAREVRVGDVILVRREGTTSTPVLHRVVTLTHRKGEVVVTTKGDSNKSADPTPYLLRGTTMTPILALPHVGRALDLARTPLGWTMLIALPASVLLWVQLRTIWFPPRQHARPLPREHAPTAG